MKQLIFIVMSGLLGLSLVPQSLSQEWQPKIRMWGGAMGVVVWDIDGHPPLMPLGGAPNSETSGAYLYNLKTLDSNSFPIDTIRHLRITSFIGDVNGDGKNDLGGSGIDRTDKLVLSPLSDEAQELPFANEGAIHNGWLRENALKDCDGDGINDVMDTRGWRANDKAYSTITYGESDGVWRTQSRVYYAENNAVDKFDREDVFDKIICFGILSGKPCYIKIVYNWVTRTELEISYKLDVLNEDDLRERRDTVRSTTVQTYKSPAGDRYHGFLIEFDDVWHLTSIAGTLHALRFTLDDIEAYGISPSFTSRLGGWIINSNSCFGQGRGTGSGFVRVDGNRPFLDYVFDRVNPEKVMTMELKRIVSSHDLQTEHLGSMVMAEGRSEPNEIGGMQGATLTPDLDGDGIEDALVHYLSVDPATNTENRVVDLFLTSQRPTVSVDEEQNQFDDQSSQALITEGGWIIPYMDGCGEVTSVPVYNAQGQQVTALLVQAHSSGLFIQDSGQLPSTPLWVVSCDVAYRLR